MFAICLGGTETSRADWQEDYAKLLAEWKQEAANTKYKTALEAADQAWIERSEAVIKIKIAEESGEKGKVPQLQKEQQEAEKKAQIQLRQAVALATAETDEVELADLLNRLALVYYFQNNWKAAAAISEHLARNHPTTDQALACTPVGINAYSQMYRRASAQEKTQVLDTLMDFYSHIAKTWKDTDQGRQALGQLAGLALRSGDRKKALQIAMQLPGNSPQRGQIQLRFALADYFDLFKLRSLEDGNPQKPSADELKAKADQTIKLLAEGVEQTRKTSAQGDLSSTLVAAELALVQLYNEQGNYPGSLRILERPDVGLLALVTKKHPAAMENDAPKRTHQLALQTYMAQANVEKSIEMLKLLGTGADDPAQITQLQLSLANKIYKEIEADRQQTEPTDGQTREQLKAKLKSLGDLLEMVAQRREGHTKRSLSWVGQTLFKLAEGADLKASSPSAEVADLYSKASSVFETLLDQEEDEKDSPRVAALAAQWAKCQRRLGNFEQAIAKLNSALRDNPSYLDGQMTASHTYQSWGRYIYEQQYLKSKSQNDLKKAIERFGYATNGGPPKKAGLREIPSPILGWARLATKLRGSSKYQARYYEAEYNLALCRRYYALTEYTLSGDSDKLNKNLANVERRIIFLHRAKPDFGDASWQKKFEVLLKSVQKQLKRKETGFPET